MIRKIIEEIPSYEAMADRESDAQVSSRLSRYSGRERRKTVPPVALLHITHTSRLLEALRSDKRAIFTAASKAQEIADWMPRPAAGITACSARLRQPGRPTRSSRLDHALESSGRIRY